MSFKQLPTIALNISKTIEVSISSKIKTCVLVGKRAFSNISFENQDIAFKTFVILLPVFCLFQSADNKALGRVFLSTCHLVLRILYNTS